MRGFLSVSFNTPTEQVPLGYANAEFSSAESSRTLVSFENHCASIIFSEDGAWDDEQEDEWNGCCEDPYDDEEEEEEIEREWCD